MIIWYLPMWYWCALFQQPTVWTCTLKPGHDGPCKASA